jgi:hypothetical protein
VPFFTSTPTRAAPGWPAAGRALTRPDGPLQHPAIWAARAVGALLLVRAVAIEVLLLAGSPAVTVSPAERFWTIALWNPWFALGGLLYLAASATRSRPTPHKRPRRHSGLRLSRNARMPSRASGS